MKQTFIFIGFLILLNSCMSSRSVIDNLKQDLNSPYSTSFFDKVIDASEINLAEVDTLFILEHYTDINGFYDQGIIWTNKGFNKCYKLKTSRKSKLGSPYRFYEGIEFIDNNNCEKFNMEKELISTWQIEKIKELDTKRQLITDGTFTLIRIVKKGKSYKGLYIQFNDLRDYE